MVELKLNNSIVGLLNFGRQIPVIVNPKTTNIHHNIKQKLKLHIEKENNYRNLMSYGYF